jgi:phosphoglycolate phosphatase
VTRLIVFDCDGTLVDSQHLIVEAAARTLAAHGLEPPPAAVIRTVIGLSLEEAIAELVPAIEERRLTTLVEAYRVTWRALREQGMREPLYPGAREVLGELDRRGHLLGVATGKSRPGLLAVLEQHELTRHFVSFQTADRHPSKPHPSMLDQAMRETGSEPGETMMVGDTSFDMAMARAAGVGAVGVAWGYHPTEALVEAGATEVVASFEALLELVASDTG